MYTVHCTLYSKKFTFLMYSTAYNLWTFTWFVHFELPFRLKGTENINTERFSKFPSNIFYSSWMKYINVFKSVFPLFSQSCLLSYVSIDLLGWVYSGSIQAVEGLLHSAYLILKDIHVGYYRTLIYWQTSD